ncbi:MAG: Spy/CpxP family protein refolding chaperone [Desulfobacterales bacterium]|nr:Spy/CpxP family protein refolding chaperone [Desulfobacterales bacterium]
MKKAIIGAAIFVFSLSAVLVTAGSPVKKESGKKEVPSLESLRLTPEQTARIRSLRESYLIDREQSRSQLVNKRMELRLLWMQVNADPAKIKDKQREIDALREQRQEKRTSYQFEFRKILTPEQLSKYIILEYGSARGKHKSKRNYRR